jgi:membrane-associated protease RseP (regulator of RpoE activity)
MKGIYEASRHGMAIDADFAAVPCPRKTREPTQTAASERPLSTQMSFVPILIISLGVAMIVHELGHVCAARVCGVSASELGLGLGPRLFGFAIGRLKFSLRAIPIASFARLDGTALNECSLPAQLLVHLGGIIFNVLAGCFFLGSMFGWINLLLAAANVLPLYKQDGWKCGVAIMRTILRKQSRPVEWTFTFSGGFASLLLVGIVLDFFR